MGGLAGGLRRRWPLLLLSPVVGALLATAYAQTRPPEYVSTTSVLVTPTDAIAAAQPANGQGLNAPVNLATEAELVRSTTVASRARVALGGPAGPERLLAAVSIQVPAESSVLRISFTAGSPERARNGAHAFALAYLGVREDLARASIEQRTLSVEEQLVEVREQLGAASAAAAQAPPNSPAAALERASADVYRSQLTALTRTLGELRGTTVSPGRLIADAVLPTEPRGPRALLLLTAGATAGLVAGSALALLWDRTDQRLRTVTRAADALGLSTLPVELELTNGSFAAVDPSSTRAAPDLLRLRNAVVTSLPEGRRTLVVVGAATGCAAGALAGALAAALAAGDDEVVLVSADASGWTDAGAPGPQQPGLGEVLAGRASLAEALRREPAVPRLRTIGVGGDVTELGHRLQSRAAEEVVAALQESADFIVIHTGPATTSADAHTIARLADAGILVLESARTSVVDAQSVVAQLREVHLTRIFCVLAQPVRGRTLQPVTVGPATGASTMLPARTPP